MYVRRGAAAVGTVLLLVGCNGGASDGQSLDVVAGGGGSSGSVEGFVSDLDVRDGRVALVGESRDDVTALWTIDEPGDVRVTTLSDLGFPTSVAWGVEDDLYVLDEAGIWQVRGGNAELVVGDDSAPTKAPTTEPGAIEAMTVDDAGRLLWTAAVPNPNGAASPGLIVVRRLDDAAAAPELVAGSTDAPVMDDATIYRQQQNPDAGTPAVGFPMLVPGPQVDLAADADAFYLLGAGYVLRVDADGRLSKVVGGEGRDVPTEPFASQGDALDNGFVPAEGGLSADEGAVAALDTSVSGETDADDAFVWTGDFTESQQDLIDRVVDEGGDGVPDSLDTVVVVVSDGDVSTAAAHVQAMALDGGQLYVVGQAGRFEATGPEEAIVLRVPVD